jgi:hypothetical protein
MHIDLLIIFGAKASMRNNAPVADVPGVQLRFNKAEVAQAPTKGPADLHQEARSQRYQARSALHEE